MTLYRRSPRSSSRDPRVLVTGGEHTSSLAAVRALRSAGYEPWVAASSRTTLAARSRAASGLILVPHSGHDPEGFIENVRLASEAHRFTGLLVGTERDLIAAARQRQQVGTLAFCIPELSTVLGITSKGNVNRLASEAGLKVPCTVEVERDDLRVGECLRYPLIIKPCRSELDAHGSGLVHLMAHRVSSYAELRHLAPAVAGERWLLQSSIEGQLGAICGVAWHGTVVCAVHQMSKRIWPTDIGVSAYAQTVPPDHELQAGVARVVGELGWSGVFQAQFIHSEDGSYFIDLNPRIYGSLALATAAGVNLPATWVALLSGRTVKVDPYRVGVHYRAEQDVRALLHLLGTGRPAAVFSGLAPRRHTTHAVVKLTDPLPALTSLTKLFGRLAKRP